MICYKNGEIQRSIAVQDRAFHYGDGCFTTAKVVHDQVQLWSKHLKRLQSACEKLKLSCDLAVIQQSLKQLKATQAEALNGSLKIVISRGEGQRGYAFPDHAADIWLFFYPSTIEQGVCESIIDQVELLDLRMGLTMPELVGIKSLNRLEQVMLKQEASSKGLTEALVADVNDSIVEGISSNCFMRVNNRWISPNLGYNGVHGVMRAEILARMQQLDIACFEETITIAQLSQVDVLFFCNALHPMQIAAHFNGRKLCTEPAQTLFKQLQLNQIDGLWLNQ
ncbi:aminodeoxychorismate lyase [Acinetobacter sp. MD2(2019)]|uniref:aminodeoxychorismate lyase n=1 Tax=Acinetobacter sp. MD2(2019) TaxID=2605273 RepID=UPI002D1F91AA|nr:aminodeoxychorismate lyase [Acinetobacter sp. MD2(2019)]MEB3754386.1 aminodeoxychorismate lyase [Acinetobacter sp. MD2(2019)]